MPNDRSPRDTAESGVTGGVGLLDGVARACTEVDRPALGQAIELLDSVRRKLGRVYLMGNGGSAATASHLACDLIKGVAHGTETGVRAIGLSDNSSMITAWTNDVGPSSSFAGQLAALLDPDDVVLAISVSGNSPNILAGLKMAREMDARIIGMLGCDGGAALSMVDIALLVPCSDYGVVETIHLGFAHALVTGLRARRGHPAPAVRRAAELPWAQN